MNYKVVKGVKADGTEKSVDTSSMGVKVASCIEYVNTNFGAYRDKYPEMHNLEVLSDLITKFIEGNRHTTLAENIEGPSSILYSSLFMSLTDFQGISDDLFDSNIEEIVLNENGRSYAVCLNDQLDYLTRRESGPAYMDLNVILRRLGRYSDTEYEASLREHVYNCPVLGVKFCVYGSSELRASDCCVRITKVSRHDRT